MMALFVLTVFIGFAIVAVGHMFIGWSFNTTYDEWGARGAFLCALGTLIAGIGLAGGMYLIWDAVSKLPIR